VLEKLKSLGVEPGALAQPQADAFFRAETEKWGKMVGGIGLATN
jgi:hypothetical protein